MGRIDACVLQSAQVSLRRLQSATIDGGLGNLMALKPLEISMPWRDLIMGEPERLLEWALAGDLKSVHFSDGSGARCECHEWVVTAGSDEASEAAEFIGELIERSGPHGAAKRSLHDAPSVR